MTNHKAIYATIILMLVISIGLVIYGIYQAILEHSPAVELTPNEITIIEPTCPDDVVYVDATLSIRRPTVVETSIAFIDIDTRQIVPRSEDYMPPRPRPIVESVSINLPITIPNFPPGKYERVAALQEKSGGSDPSFFVIRFEISGNCASLYD